METKDNRKASETEAWSAYQKYKNGFLANSRAIESIRERRKFYDGDQYEAGMPNDIPKPVMNICFEYVEKVTAKITDTLYAVEFTAEDDANNLHTLDQFYEYQIGQMDEKKMNALVVRNALIDGVACVFTVYDEDTYGFKGEYRGFLKRIIVPFEDVFFANPYCEDPQDQRYLGFVQRVDIDYAKSLCEDKKSQELIVEDDVENPYNYNKADIGHKTCTLVTRYFRDDSGEVCFEVATRYASIYKKPRYLNPKKDKFDDKKNKETDDYENMGAEKATVQTAPIPQSNAEYKERLKVFWRYPFSWYRPYPVNRSVLGNSVLTQIIPNQKQINFTNMMAMLDFQNHGMAKYAVAKGSLAKGTIITNDPGQVLEIETRGGASVGNYIQRLEPSNVSAEQLNQGYSIVTAVRQIYGFDNLTADNNLNDTSGYALQQVQKQQNLVLQIPQDRFWLYIKENAKIDLLFFRDFVDHAKFYTPRGQGEMNYQNNMGAMLQSVADARGEQLPTPSGRVEKVKPWATGEIKSDDFMRDFEISVDVTQGIAQSQIAESQHYSQVMQWMMSGNVDASLIKSFVDADPSFSKKTRQNLSASLQALEDSQLHQKEAEIENLKNVVRQLQQGLQYANQQINQQNVRLKAQQTASEDNRKRLEAITKGAMARADTLQGQLDEATGQMMSQGEVKSNNALGMEGGSFDTYVA